jgi:aminoglycoside phosphotransferase (APT) family kinase protein
MAERHDDLIEALRRMGLVGPGEEPVFTPLPGGVSSDIYRVGAASGPFCVKRALARLRVAGDWRAQVERNHYEAQWMRVVASVSPVAAPGLLGEDEATGCFAMDWLDPDSHPVWKAQLRDGTVEPATAAAVGRRVARIHAATAGRGDIAERFATGAIFHAIRIEPYLLATAARHPPLAARLEALARTTAGTRQALVHGDVSPKNILVGPHGPVFLDAECAWYGDPAFDLAFCLNHLLLKCLWRPHWAERYLSCFESLQSAYLDAADWEPRDELESRTARLLPGLFLARVDGKSPVEYLAAEASRQRVRRFAARFLLDPVDRLGTIRLAWKVELSE